MRKIPVIVGPTATGKTKLSLIIASRIKAEIISADSRQIHRLMDIGTAKPTKLEQSLVPHNFIDIKYPNEPYSSGEFGREARLKIDELLAKNIVPIIVGGAGFYIRALVDGLMAPRLIDTETRQKLNEEFREYGLAKLFQKLKQVDPHSAGKIKENDKHRILRALEVFEITGRPFSVFSENQPKPANFSAQFWGLFCDRKELYRKIETRADLMLRDGLIEEVISIRKKGYSPKINALQTVGYKEVFDHLDGKLQYNEMV